jgi:hypothetical protein
MATQKEIEAVLKGVKLPKKRIEVQVDRNQASIKTVPLVIRTQPIAIGTPMDELMYSRCHAGFMGLDWMPWDAQLFTFSTYLPDARNQIHNNFLKSGLPWLMMLDSDIWAPQNLIQTLLDHNLPVVGGWYSNKKREDSAPVVYDYVGERESGGMYGVVEDYFQQRSEPGAQRMERVGGIGAGCLLMRRDVAEALGENPYDMNRGGEDLTLCRKIKAAGYDIWVDWTAHCRHMGVTYA